jgi:hypothetical protein
MDKETLEMLTKIKETHEAIMDLLKNQGMMIGTLSAFLASDDDKITPDESALCGE